MNYIVSLLVLGNLLAIISSAHVHYVKIHQSESLDCTYLSEEILRKYKGFNTEEENAFVVKVGPGIKTILDTNIKITNTSKIIEIYARKQTIIDEHLSLMCKILKTLEPLPIFQKQPEIVKIIDGGNQTNRIDVVFMGDGYQPIERNQFFDDIRRLAEDMFTGPTFRSYLPVFNIWAIYVESIDSGIGYNGPKNTPFKLYREAGQLRVIWPGDSNYARQVCRLIGTSGCDYPSLIGNDDFYGGLGGEFVVSTKSNRTGTIVLRHEMGHNFANVGDEYDNSWAYFGANSARNIADVGWSEWFTNNGPIQREERAMYRLLEYPWADLSKGSKTFTFTSDGQYSRWYLLLSVSAAGENDSLEFILDGKILPWITHGFDDREFYDWYGDNGFTQGLHNFTVRSKTEPTHKEIPRMICSITLHEYGNINEFHDDNNYISAYPTWGDESIGRIKTLRPTNAGCLMRNMSHSEFCHICKQGMWHEFLQKISLIDSINISLYLNPNGTRGVILNTIKLGQLRAPGNEIIGERLNITWFFRGVEQIHLKDQFHFNGGMGAWTVRVQFITLEVRSDPKGLLIETENFIV